MRNREQIPFGIAILTIGFNFMPLPLDDMTGLRWFSGIVLFLMGVWIIFTSREFSK